MKREEKMRSIRRRGGGATCLKISLFAAIVIGIIWMFKRLPIPNPYPDSDQSQLQQNGPKIQKPFMILSMYRSGSSFVGEYLKAYPDVYYMFEPLSILTLDPEGFQRIAREEIAYINQIMHCDFKKVFDTAWDVFGYTQTILLRHWLERSFCSSTTAISSCTTGDSEVLNSLCRRRSHVVAKVIRVKELDSVSEYMDEGGKILHLFRDPRGVINSMKGVDAFKKRERTIEDYAVQVCEVMENMVVYAKGNHVTKRETYKIARYENFALEPMKQGERLYEFFGEAVPKEVEDRITQLTQVTQEEEDEIKKNPSEYLYSTRKNPITTAFAWRKTLTWKEVSHIQNMCTDVFILLGYRQFDSEEEFLDFTIDTLIEPEVTIL